MEPLDRPHYVDYTLAYAAFFILAMGLLMVASSSMGVAEKVSGSSLYYLVKQALYLTVSLLVARYSMRFPVKWWFDKQVLLLFLSFFLLALVIVPGVGHSVNGSIRWLRIGPVSLQVSEATKLFMLVYLSGYLVRHRDSFEETVLGWVKPLALLLVSGGMLLIEPDFGSVVVILLSAFSLFFLAGLRLRYVFLLLGLLLSAFTLLIVLAPYRLERMTAFLHPWENQFGSGYQLTQSLIAFGRGGIFGVGLGNGLQKLFYLPEAHTDFLFAVLAEELGLLGCFVVFFAYGLVMWRSLCIGRKAYCLGLYFHAYLAYGLGVCFGTQAIVNFAVNMGWLPTKGLTLPLMSYGGSSLLVNCVVIALLLRISHEVSSGDYKKSSNKIPGASGLKLES